MVAVNKETNERFQIVKYSLRVHERGSDTEFSGGDSFTIYNPINRSKIEVRRKHYFICDNWKQAEEMFGPQPEIDEDY